MLDAWATQCSGGIHRYVKAHIIRLGLDTSHFTGQSLGEGSALPGRRARSLDELLVERSTYHAGDARGVG